MLLMLLLKDFQNKHEWELVYFFIPSFLNAQKCSRGIGLYPEHRRQHYVEDSVYCMSAADYDLRDIFLYVDDTV